MGEDSEVAEFADKAEDRIQKKNENAVAADVAAAATDSSRVMEWFLQAVFSAINLGSHLSAMSRRCIPSDLGCIDYTMTRADKWTTSVESISLALALIMVILHYCCCKYLTKWALGKLPEGITALIVLGFVAAGMPAIMNPANEQALNTDGTILNANLYFFSWASLAVAIYVFCSWLFATCFKDRNLSPSVPKNKWYFLLAAAVVVTSSSSRLYTTAECSGDSSDYCQRVKYAIAAGSIGTFFALVASVLSFIDRLGVYPEAGFAFLVFIIFILGIIFITFGGDDAPADNVGNLYFSTWLSFVFSMMLASRCFNDIKKKRKGGDEEEEEGAEAAKDVEEQPEEAKEEAVDPEISGEDPNEGEF